jgi:lipopolysaccharide biosynthesis glycosyltransferase
MNVGFYLISNHDPGSYLRADMLIRSIKKTMPGKEIAQFTNKTSSVLYGIKEIRKNAAVRLEHYAQMSGDWMFIDTDTIVQNDISSVFDKPFDIAIADRNGSLLPSEAESDFMKQQPYNLGVVFSRCPEFWKETVREWNTFPDSYRKQLVSDQCAVNNVIRKYKFDVLILDGEVYNYSPHDPNEDVSNHSIVHYKGIRKEWMMRRFYDN